MNNRKSFQKPNETLYVPGRNATKECINSGHAIEVYCLARFENDPLSKFAKEKGVRVIVKQERELVSYVRGEVFQGYVTLAKLPRTYSLKELVAQAKKETDEPLLAILDGIEDPHNLGAILRSADALGVNGIILKTHGGVRFTPTVAKISTGAIFYVPIAFVTNLHQAIIELKKEGFWCIGTSDSASEDYSSLDPSGPLVVTIGSEGKGISRLLLSDADFKVKIPMKGHVSCLNASVASAIIFAHLSYLRSLKKD